MDDNLQRLDTEVTMALVGLDARTTQYAPKGRDDKWSIQQIAEHLQLAVEMSSRGVEARLERGAPARGNANLSQVLGQWAVIKLGWFPATRESPEATTPKRPAVLRNGAQLADRIHAALLEFDKLARKAQKLFGNGPVLRHTVLGPLSIPAWNRFHLLHGQHHIRQMDRIRRDWHSQGR